MCEHGDIPPNAKNVVDLVCVNTEAHSIEAKTVVDFGVCEYV